MNKTLSTRKAEMIKNKWLGFFLIMQIVNMNQYLCASSIQSQEEEQKEGQTSSCSHSLHTIFVCGL